MLEVQQSPVHVVKCQVRSTVALGHAALAFFVHTLSTHFLVERLLNGRALCSLDQFRIQGEVETRSKTNGAENLTQNDVWGIIKLDELGILYIDFFFTRRGSS